MRVLPIIWKRTRTYNTCIQCAFVSSERGDSGSHIHENLLLLIPFGGFLLALSQVGAVVTGLVGGLMLAALEDKRRRPLSALERQEALRHPCPVISILPPCQGGRQATERHPRLLGHLARAAHHGELVACLLCDEKHHCGDRLHHEARDWDLWSV